MCPMCDGVELYCGAGDALAFALLDGWSGICVGSVGLVGELQLSVSPGG